MNDVLKESLYERNKRKFAEIEETAKSFFANYCGSTIIRDSIFGITANYARIKEIPLEILRYPFRDEELWAFTFVKKGTIFLCINTDIEIYKQIFASAHELYHIYCYAKDIDGTIANGSLLDSKTASDIAESQEDREANAFAGLVLMPGNIMDEQLKIYGIADEEIFLDDIITLMDIFALPYKAVVLRLVENHNIKEEKAQELLVNSCNAAARIEITGKAAQWQLKSNQLLKFGSLLDNMEYNSEYELLTESRKNTDREYIDKIRKDFLGES